MADVLTNTESRSVHSTRTNNDYTYIGSLLLLALFGEVFVALYVTTSAQLTDALSAVSTITGVALASLMAGGLIGFLFGIPRRLQETSPDATPNGGAQKSDRPLYSGNTNLEQVSDWLTKIIIGVSLVQLLPIVGFVRDTGTMVAQSLGTPDQIAFPISVIVLYAICGFMIGYLWARLYLGKALDAAERQTLEEVIDELKQQNLVDAETIKLVRAQLSDETRVRPSTEELERAVKSASTDTKTYAFYLAQNLRTLNWRDRKAVMERCIPVFRALIASDTEGAFHRNFGQLAYALKDQRSPDWKQAEENFTKAIDMRGPAQEQEFHAYEANRAICRIQQDSALAKKAAAEEGVRNRIVEDLKVAMQDEWTREWLQKEQLVTNWLAQNKLTWEVVRQSG
jgi:hypothetical protein